MTTVYFNTPGNIDVRALTTLGVSVKTGPSPIGYFGTGFKYALAILLRTGHTVRLWNGLEEYNFEARPAKIRGTTFQIIHMNGTSLGFTTDLGKNWELWQAFRELHSNTLDEGGTTDVVPPARDAWSSVLEVSGPAFYRQYLERGAIFLDTEPLHKGVFAEIHPGTSHHLFYRGVRALKLTTPSKFTYNLTEQCSLTEDRTLANEFHARMLITDTLLSAPAEIVRATVTEFEIGASFEAELNYNTALSAPNGPWLTEMEALYTNSRTRLNRTALDIFLKYRPRAKVSEPTNLTEHQLAVLRTATDFLEGLGFRISEFKIIVVESLGDGVLGEAKDGNIYVTLEAFNMGQKQVAGTLFEEWVHLKHGKKDLSRSMQNFLVDQVMSLGERITGVRL